MPGQCKFQPTCSDYAAEAVSIHGAATGSFLSVRRIARCHPFAVGGYDPPPKKAKTRTSVHQ